MTAAHGPWDHQHDHRHGPQEHGSPEQFWEEHYARGDRVWSGRANPLLVDVVEPLPPGAALDLGCGEGGDAVWLARRGWQVLGVDVSATALARTRAAADAAGVGDRVRVEQHDLALTFPAGGFDLVAASYLQSPVAFPRARVLEAAAGAVRPGGLLVVLEHALVPPSSAAGPGPSTPQEVWETLGLDPDRWRPERLAAAPRPVTRPDGRSATVTDHLVAARRAV